MAACYRNIQMGKQTPKEKEGIRYSGCKRPSMLMYLVYKGGAVHILRNSKQFQTFFAPIESLEEAMDHINAQTRGSTSIRAVFTHFYYSQADIDNRLSSLAKELENDKPKITPEGYSFPVYSGPDCSFAGLEIHSAWYVVHPDGSFSITGGRLVYTDPHMKKRVD